MVSFQLAIKLKGLPIRTTNLSRVRKIEQAINFQVSKALMPSLSFKWIMIKRESKQNTLVFI